MASVILTLSVLLFLCILLSHLGGKAGLPSLLLFICIGMAASYFGQTETFRSFHLANGVSTIGLIFIMFYGGFGTSWRRARKNALPAGILSSLGVILTALLVMVFCHLALGIPVLYRPTQGVRIRRHLLKALQISLISMYGMRMFVSFAVTQAAVV